MNFSYAIFDLDGTLLDSMTYWRNNIALFAVKEKGYSVSKQTEEKTYGMYADKAMALLRCELNITEDIPFSSNYREAVLRPTYENIIEPKPHAIEFLRLLKAKGIKMCLATATDRDLFMPAVKKHGMEEFFEFMITTSEVGKSKASSDIYDIALERLGGTKENTVVFEDAPYCINTASKAGYRIFAIDDDYSRYDRENTEKLCERYITDYGMFIKEILN